MPEVDKLAPTHQFCNAIKDGRGMKGLVHRVHALPGMVLHDRLEHQVVELFISLANLGHDLP
jgi:hypothetical protein